MTNSQSPDPRAALADELKAARNEIVLTIAFLGRDAGTQRLSGTIDGLIKRLAAADKAILAALRSLSPYSGAAGEAVAWRRRRKGTVGNNGWIMCPENPGRDAEFDLQPLYAHPTPVPRHADANRKDAEEFCKGAFGPFVTDVSQYVQIVRELLEHASNRASVLPRDAEEADFKLTYIKRWRTIVKLPAKYADEIRDALAVSLPRDAVARLHAYILHHYGNAATGGKAQENFERDLVSQIKALALPRDAERETIEKILFKYFYNGEPGEHEAIQQAANAILALPSIPPVEQEAEATFGEDGYNPAYDDGITFAIIKLAELTGSKDWQMRDGSEDHDTDVRDTIMDVLKCAGLYDDETGKFAALPSIPRPLQSTTEQADASRDHPVREVVAEAIRLESCTRGYPVHPNVANHLAAAAIAALTQAPPPREGVERFPIPTPDQIEPILDDFLGFDSPHDKEFRRRCAQRIFDMCVVVSGMPIKPSDNRISPSPTSVMPDEGKQK